MHFLYGVVLQARSDPTPPNPMGVIPDNRAQMHRPFRVRITEEWRCPGRSSGKCRSQMQNCNYKMPGVQFSPQCAGPWCSLGIWSCISVLPVLVLGPFQPLLDIDRKTKLEGQLSSFPRVPYCYEQLQKRIQDHLLSSEIHTHSPPEAQRMFPHLPFAKVLPLCRRDFNIMGLEEDGAEEEAGILCWVSGACRTAALFSSVVLYLPYRCCSFKVMLETNTVLRKTSNSYRWRLKSLSRFDGKLDLNSFASFSAVQDVLTGDL